MCQFWGSIGLRSKRGLVSLNKVKWALLPPWLRCISHILPVRQELPHLNLHWLFWMSELISDVTLPFLEDFEKKCISTRLTEHKYSPQSIQARTLKKRRFTWIVKLGNPVEKEVERRVITKCSSIRWSQEGEIENSHNLKSIPSHCHQFCFQRYHKWRLNFLVLRRESP